MKSSVAGPSPYLTVSEAATHLNTSVRFVRRLISERRIAFHHVAATCALLWLIWRRSSRPDVWSR